MLSWTTLIGQDACLVSDAVAGCTATRLPFWVSISASNSAASPVSGFALPAESCEKLA